MIAPPRDSEVTRKRKRPNVDQGQLGRRKGRREGIRDTLRVAEDACTPVLCDVEYAMMNLRGRAALELRKGFIRALSKVLLGNIENIRSFLKLKRGARVGEMVVGSVLSNFLTGLPWGEGGDFLRRNELLDRHATLMIIASERFPKFVRPKQAPGGPSKGPSGEGPWGGDERSSGAMSVSTGCLAFHPGPSGSLVCPGGMVCPMFHVLMKCPGGLNCGGNPSPLASGSLGTFYCEVESQVTRHQESRSKNRDLGLQALLSEHKNELLTTVERLEAWLPVIRLTFCNVPGDEFNILLRDLKRDCLTKNLYNATYSAFYEVSNLPRMAEVPLYTRATSYLRYHIPVHLMRFGTEDARFVRLDGRDSRYCRGYIKSIHRGKVRVLPQAWFLEEDPQTLIDFKVQAGAGMIPTRCQSSRIPDACVPSTPYYVLGQMQAMYDQMQAMDDQWEEVRAQFLKTHFSTPHLGIKMGAFRNGAGRGRMYLAAEVDHLVFVEYYLCTDATSIVGQYLIHGPRGPTMDMSSNEDF
jgi:hypothetical protein